MLKDKAGLIWFGTNDGLVKYDGYQTTTFQNNRYDDNSISGNLITNLIEDDFGQIWVGTIAGLDVYNKTENRFRHFKNNPNDQFSINSNEIKNLFKDSDGVIWVITKNGLNRYNDEKQNFTRFYHSDETINRSMLDMVNTDKNGFWISSAYGLIHFDKKSTEYTHYKGSPITALLADKSGYIWFGTHENGLKKFDPKTRQKISTTGLSFDDLNLVSISNDYVRTFAENDEGLIWIGMLNGLSIYNPKTGKSSRYFHNPNDSKSLLTNKVSLIYHSSDNVTWLGTDGIQIVNPLSRFTHKIIFSKYVKENQYINTISLDSNDLWVGTNTNGLLQFNFKTGNLTTIFKHNKQKNHSLSNNIVRHIIQDSNYLWITTGYGLNRFNKKTKTFTYFFPDPKAGYTGEINQLGRSAFDKEKKNIWIASRGGLLKFNISIESFTAFMKPISIRNLLVDKKKTIWLCTTNGLYRYKPEKNTFDFFQHNPNDLSSLSANRVNSILETRGGDIWIATSAGLNRFISDSNHFEYFGRENNLTLRSIADISEVSDGYLWLSGLGGLSKFNTKTKRSITILDKAAQLHFSGNYLFVGNTQYNTISYFKPELIKNSEFLPKVKITNFKIFNKSFPELAVQELIRLDYEQNVFTIDFAALEYRFPKKNMYRYKLDGFDKDWISTNEKRSVTYTNLDPGNYTFTIFATNNDGIWNEKATELQIEVLPAYWQTWWFKLIIIAFIFGILLIIHFFRLNKLMEIQSVREKISSDLHDDLGTSLTRMAMFIEICKIQPKQISTYLEKLGTSLKISIATLDDIVWSVESKNDVASEMIMRLEYYVRHIFENTQTKVNFNKTVDNMSLIINGDTRKHIYLIFKEAVTNVYKHSNASSIDIAIKLKNKEFNMSISDNGTKKPDPTLRKGNGLRNMEMRAKKISGELLIHVGNHYSIVLKCKLSK